MKRKWTAALLAAMMILSLAGCAPKADVPKESAATDVAEKTPAATVAATPAPNPLDQLNGIDAADVRQIDMYTDSASPDKPVAVYSSPEDITAVMEWFSQLQVDQALAVPETGAPGDWRYYELALFDGRAFKIHFGGDTISADGAQFRYTGPEAPELTKELWLDVDDSSFSADTEIINYSLHNDTGGEAVLLFEPLLERATASGWEPLTRTEEFCGVTDPMTATIIEHELPMEWFPDAGPGVYRLSLEAYDEDDNPFIISDIFEIG